MDFKIIKQHLLSRTGNVWHQLLRNSLVGGFTLGCDLFILFILVDVFHCQKIIATVISSIVGGIISFAISSRWVFNQRRFNNVPLEFLLYTLIGALGLGINTLLFWVFESVIGVYYLVAKIISCVIVFLTNFFLRKYVIFFKKEKKSKEEDENEIEIAFNAKEEIAS